MLFLLLLLFLHFETCWNSRVFQFLKLCTLFLFYPSFTIFEIIYNVLQPFFYFEVPYQDSQLALWSGLICYSSTFTIDIVSHRILCGHKCFVFWNKTLTFFFSRYFFLNFYKSLKCFHR